jgi:hypothetical protein
MNLRRVLGLDLCGKLRTYKRRYHGDVRVFDHSSITCSISKYNGGIITVSASAYCTDLATHGLSVSDVAWFYTSPYLHSMSEAELYLAQEVGRAARHFPETSFFRTINEQRFVWSNGEWVSTDQFPTVKRCRGCGLKTDEPFCPNCGEPTFI